MAIKIALAGNPNCGKTTLFNLYTGSSQYVGNWAGVTVEKKEGLLRRDGREILLTDLPGIYSLSHYGAEERVARSFLINETPDVIINIVDGSNLERNLYLSVQVMELSIPTVVAVNMMDEVRARGEDIDCDGLSRRLDVPVVPVSAKRGENTGELLRVAVGLAEASKCRRPGLHAGGMRYDAVTSRALQDIWTILMEDEACRELPLRYYSSRLLEGDDTAEAELKLSGDRSSRIRAICDAYEKSSGHGDREAMLADARYRAVTAICARVRHRRGEDAPPDISGRIDMVLTHRILALPVFLTVMFLVFAAVFGPPGSGMKLLLQNLFQVGIAGAVRNLLDLAEAPGWTYGLLIDAVIGGVGGVLAFIPQIGILFTCLSVLEDSGYMARAAFMMDRLLSGVGLTGKSFIPLLMGFGCTTPAVMASRAMDSDRDRRMTIMITPFISCGARLPIYALFTSVFFEGIQGPVVFSLYIIGMLTAVLSGLLLKNTLFGGVSSPFVMELPPYRFPAPGTLLRHVWDKCAGFVTKAGTLIFSMSVLIWLLQNLDWRLRLVTDSSESVFASLGRLIAPVFGPLGFGNWQAAVSLLSGIIAKETVVSTMSVLYGASGQGGLHAGLSGAFTPLSAFSFMVFCLLYTPCVSAFVTIRRELNSLAWALGAALFNTGTAYVVSLLVFQVGRRLIAV